MATMAEVICLVDKNKAVDLCSLASLYSHADGGVPHVGRNSPQSPANISSVKPQTWLPCWPSRQNCLYSPGRCRAEEEIETKATQAGVIWFVDEDEAVQRILEVISRDEIAMVITYQEAKEHVTWLFCFSPVLENS